MTRSVDNGSRTGRPPAPKPDAAKAKKATPPAKPADVAVVYKEIKITETLSVRGAKKHSITVNGAMPRDELDNITKSLSTVVKGVIKKHPVDLAAGIEAGLMEYLSRKGRSPLTVPLDVVVYNNGNEVVFECGIEQEPTTSLVPQDVAPVGAAPALTAPKKLPSAAEVKIMLATLTARIKGEGLLEATLEEALGYISKLGEAYEKFSSDLKAVTQVPREILFELYSDVFEKLASDLDKKDPNLAETRQSVGKLRGAITEAGRKRSEAKKEERKAEEEARRRREREARVAALAGVEVTVPAGSGARIDARRTPAGDIRVRVRFRNKTTTSPVLEARGVAIADDLRRRDLEGALEALTEITSLNLSQNYGLTVLDLLSTSLSRFGRRSSPNCDVILSDLRDAASSYLDAEINVMLTALKSETAVARARAVKRQMEDLSPRDYLGAGNAFRIILRSYARAGADENKMLELFNWLNTEFTEGRIPDKDTAAQARRFICKSG